MFLTSSFPTASTRSFAPPRAPLTTKRAFDILAVLAVAPIALALLALILPLVKLDGGPAFFGHRRVGRGNKEFRCWKIRTMVPQAEQILREQLHSDDALSAQWNAHRKLPQDSRITWTGRFLRGWSLDEVPQLWNVLRGDMSLVGPRPVTRSELAKYGADAWSYLAVQPGVTGLWQVSGRNDTSYAERVRLDTRYCQSITVLGDLGILVRTVGVVLRRTGA